MVEENLTNPIKQKLFSKKERTVPVQNNIQSKSIANNLKLIESNAHACLKLIETEKDLMKEIKINKKQESASPPREFLNSKLSSLQNSSFSTQCRHHASPSHPKSNCKYK